MHKKLLVLLAVALFSCSGQSPKPESPLGGRINVGSRMAQIVVYARSAMPVAAPLVWEIRKISLNREDGTQFDIPGSAVNVDLARLPLGQSLLTVSEIEQGSYTGISIFTSQVYSERTREEVPTEAKVQTVHHSFSVLAGNAKSLTLVIDLPYSTGEGGAAFKPGISVEEENPRPQGKLVYVANERSSNISVIDKRLKRVVHNVLVGTMPHSIAADERRGRLYIADRKDGVLYEMDMVSHHLLKAEEVDFADEPVHIEPIPSKDILMVVNFGTDSVYLIDSFTFQIITQIPVPDGPVEARYSVFNELGFVLSRRFGTVAVLDFESMPAEVDTVLSVEMEPTSMAMYEVEGWLFIANRGSADITVIKMETLGIEKSITVGIGAGNIAFDPFGRVLYVAMTTTNEILCVDPFTEVILWDIKLPARPGKMLFDPDEKELYAAIPDLNAVVVVNPIERKVQNWIETGHRPTQIAFRRR
jgi:YVTN family beta-propeller protein